MKLKNVKVVALVLAMALCFSTLNIEVFAHGNNAKVKKYEADSYVEYPEVDGEEIIFQLNMDTGEEVEVENAPDYNSVSSKARVAVRNYVFIAITPQSTSYKITVTNLGVDTIDSVNLSCKVYKNSGSYMKGKTKTLKKVKPGKTSWTWSTAKGETVQETIKVSGTARDGKDVISFSGSTVRYNFVGGKYGTMKAYDGQRHHVPSKDISPLSAYSGPAIRMITSDHKKTASYGSSTSAKNFRAKEKAKIKAGEFLGAQKLGITDLQSKFGSKYNAAINSMVTYTKGLGYKK